MSKQWYLCILGSAFLLAVACTSEATSSWQQNVPGDANGDNLISDLEWLDDTGF